MRNVIMKIIVKFYKPVIFILLTLVFNIHADKIPVGEKYWIFFTDKKHEVFLKDGKILDGENPVISKRAISRRVKVLHPDNTFDISDVPVNREYIKQIEELGFKAIVLSRWLNAVSLIIPEEKIGEVTALPFVKKIQPVCSYIIEPPEGLYPENIITKAKDTHMLDYGMSFTQNSLINIPEVHDLGINGNGVLIGMIDTGFDYKDRSVFSDLNLLSEYDFHWDDSLTANDALDPSYQHNHGTQTLSVIGGYLEGSLIGPAFGATFALAKTEWVANETRIEEDHWVAGIEWLEALGVDIVSSSLGYSTFDGGIGYTYEDLDGNTCVTTIAADIAVRKGVVVLNSAGNEGNNPWKFIISPADGDSVIAVGGVYETGNLIGFSSVGPTYDGRIKPDVVAMASGVYAVYPQDKYSFAWVGGTSFSCPLVAGVCAMILQAHPELGPMDVAEALRQTADRAEFPDNEYGWGLVNAYDAIFYHGMIFTNFNNYSLPAENCICITVDILSKNGINRDSVLLHYKVEHEQNFKSVKMDQQGGVESNIFASLLNSAIDIYQIQFYLEAEDTLGEKHIGPFGYPNILYSFSDTTSQFVYLPQSTPRSFYLYQNYPNPFNPSTHIKFDISKISHVSLKIYNMLGQEIITLIDRSIHPGKVQVIWNGEDNYGRSVPSGLYFYQLNASGEREIRKMILAK
jgi:hypothetical protein